MLSARLDHDVDAFVVFLDYRKRAAGSLQKRGQFRFDKSLLLVRVAHVAERRAHIHGAASVTLIKHVITSEMNFGWLSGSLQLLQMTIAELVLFVPFVADRLRVGNALRNRRSRDCARVCIPGGVEVGRHLEFGRSEYSDQRLIVQLQF